jgi:hypothetical protein
MCATLRNYRDEAMKLGNIARAIKKGDSFTLGRVMTGKEAATYVRWILQNGYEIVPSDPVGDYKSVIYSKGSTATASSDGNSWEKTQGGAYFYAELPDLSAGRDSTAKRPAR